MLESRKEVGCGFDHLKSLISLVFFCVIFGTGERVGVRVYDTTFTFL